MVDLHRDEVKREREDRYVKTEKRRHERLFLVAL